jgi:alpha-beta hydrolase superfamily lysophospholipase
MENIQESIAGEGTLEGSGGIRLFFRSWRPFAMPRGVVAIVPGFNSHSGYYAWVGNQLASHDLSVYAVDLRGRGKSDGERFYVEKFADYADDIAALIDHVKFREPGLPVFLLGHSAGGVLACLYALDRPGELSGLISESFAFQTPAPEFALAVLKGLGHIAPHAHVLRLKNEDFSRDPGVLEALNSDPLIAHETQPTRTVAELVRADERLKKEFPALSIPLLILHGAADKAARPNGSQFFYDTAGSADKTLKFYEGSYHDPLNDLDKETVLKDIENWIAERLGAQIHRVSAAAGRESKVNV